MNKKEKIKQVNSEPENKKSFNFDKENIRLEFRKELIRLRNSYYNGAEKASTMAKEADGAMQSQHDTTKVEQSWLANALGKMAGGIGEIIENWDKLIPSKEYDEVNMGALVYLKDLNYSDEEWFYLLPFGGGVSTEINHQKIEALSIESPLGKNLLGKKKGEIIEFKIKEKQKFEVLEVL